MKSKLREFWIQDYGDGTGAAWSSKREATFWSTHPVYGNKRPVIKVRELPNLKKVKRKAVRK